METEPCKGSQCLTTPKKLSMEVELGSNDGNVRFRDWNYWTYNAHHVVFLKSKCFLLLPRLLVKNGRVLQLFSDGNDKQSFPSKQCVLTHAKVHLLLRKGNSRYRPRRAGGRKCKLPENLQTKKASTEPKYPRFSILPFHVSCIAMLIYRTEEIMQ